MVVGLGECINDILRETKDSNVLEALHTLKDKYNVLKNIYFPKPTRYYPIIIGEVLLDTNQIEEIIRIVDCLIANDFSLVYFFIDDMNMIKSTDMLQNGLCLKLNRYTSPVFIYNSKLFILDDYRINDYVDESSLKLSIDDLPTKDRLYLINKLLNTE